MAGNSNLNQANKAKKDEFYTQLGDIEKELRHYRAHFRGKCVLCNCDDPYESNFFKFFAMNFNALGLKRLVATCYATSPVAGREMDLFGWAAGAAAGARPPAPPAVGGGRPPKIPHKIVINEVGDVNGDGRIDLADVEWLIKNDRNVLSRLEGDGDFRSAECIALLDEADIVVTNPPFSLFREYLAQLIRHGKKFLIVGSQNNVTYKEAFLLFMNNQVWLGYQSGDMAFRVPAYYEERETRFWVDGTGQKWRSLGNICWFTNLDIAKRHENIPLFRKYTPEAYPKYANYDAIEVAKVSDIPCDYDGEMGVPITFLDKYNPEQFEIIGSSRWLGRPMSEIAPKGTYVSGGVRFYLKIALDNAATMCNTFNTADSGQRTADSGQRTAA